MNSIITLETGDKDSLKIGETHKELDTCSFATMYRKESGEKIYMVLVLVQLPKTVSGREIQNVTKITYMKTQIKP